MVKTHIGGGVVISLDGKILVVSQHGNSWSLPKGHVDPGEDIRQAAAREIREESGIKDLDYIKDLGSYERHKIGIDGGEDKSEMKTIEFFLYRTNEIELQPEDSNNPEARWVEPEEVAGLLTHPRDAHFFIQVLPEIKEVIAKTS